MNAGLVTTELLDSVVSFLDPGTSSELNEWPPQASHRLRTSGPAPRFQSFADAPDGGDGSPADSSPRCCEDIDAIHRGVGSGGGSS